MGKRRRPRDVRVQRLVDVAAPTCICPCSDTSHSLFFLCSSSSPPRHFLRMHGPSAEPELETPYAQTGGGEAQRRARPHDPRRQHGGSNGSRGCGEGGRCLVERERSAYLRRIGGRARRRGGGGIECRALFFNVRIYFVNLLSSFLLSSFSPCSSFLSSFLSSFFPCSSFLSSFFPSFLLPSSFFPSFLLPPFFVPFVFREVDPLELPPLLPSSSHLTSPLRFLLPGRGDPRRDERTSQDLLSTVPQEQVVGERSEA